MKLLNLAAGLALLPFLLCIGAAKEETTVNEGDAAPHFEAKTDSGETWNSKDYYDDKVVVLFFYPAAMTGG